MCYVLKNNCTLGSILRLMYLAAYVFILRTDEQIFYFQSILGLRYERKL